ncbi:hypothetical protein PSEUDO8AS_10165 [Pseudomonas sp. 8AS]|nr:hypothetical protein PSEUDO8AS_10165 [Pseudomonas sp. 8AS]
MWSEDFAQLRAKSSFAGLLPRT